MPSAASRRVLVVGPSWIGDMVMAQTLFMSLARQEPDIAIDVVAPGWSRPILERMPQVRRAVELDVEHGKLAWRVRRRVGRALRAEGYDQAIVLPRSVKSALVPFHAGIRRRTGYKGESRYGLINDMRPLDKRALPRMTQRFVTLGLPRGGRLPDALPFPSLRVDPAGRKSLLERLGLDRSRPVVALMPGARYGPAKCWPLESYGALAARLQAAGFQVWVLGSNADRGAAETLDGHAAGVTRNLCGETGLGEAADLLSVADVAVSNDSGLMHIAAAAGTAVVAIYGSSTPDYTPPLTERTAILHLGLSCSPCFERRCRYGHYRCLTEIAVETVFAATTRLAATGVTS